MVLILSLSRALQKSSVDILSDSPTGQNSDGSDKLIGSSLAGTEAYSQEQCSLLLAKCCDMAERGCCINQGQRCFMVMEDRCEYGSQPQCVANKRQKCQNYPVKTCRDKYESKVVVS